MTADVTGGTCSESASRHANKLSGAAAAEMSANVSLNSLYGRAGTAGRVIYALERSEVMEGKTACRRAEFYKTARSREAGDATRRRRHFAGPGRR